MDLVVALSSLRMIFLADWDIRGFEKFEICSRNLTILYFHKLYSFSVDGFVAHAT